MICKLARGNGFNGRLRYAAKGQLIATNCSDTDIVEMAREMRQCANLNRRIGEPVKAIILGWDSRKESISIDTQRSIVSRALELAGYGNSPFAAYLHTDASRHHLDITTSRVGYDSQTVSDKFERVKFQKICRQLEAEFGLRQLKVSGQERVPPTAAEKGMLKEGKTPPRLVIQNAIDAICGRPQTPTLPELIEGLEKLGIQITINGSSRTGEIRGISYQYLGIAFPGSKLGTDYQVGGKGDTDILDRVFYAPEDHQQAIFGTAYDPAVHADQPPPLVPTFRLADIEPVPLIPDPMQPPDASQITPLPDLSSALQSSADQQPKPPGKKRPAMQDFKRLSIRKTHRKGGGPGGAVDTPQPAEPPVVESIGNPTKRLKTTQRKRHGADSKPKLGGTGAVPGGVPSPTSAGGTPDDPD